MEQKRGRGRPKGSTKKPKVSPLVEEKKIICAEDAYAAMVSEGLATPEEVEGIKKKVNEIVGPFNPSKLQEEFDEVFGERKIIPASSKEVAKLHNALHPNQNTEVFEVKFPEGWEKLGKIEKLQWLTANRK